MYRALLDQYNNLNANHPLDDIVKLLALACEDSMVFYPDISREHLECHAAMIRIDELRHEQTREEKPALKNHNNLITLDKLIDLMHKKESNRPKPLIRESLLKQCRRRKNEIGESPLPKPLYAIDNGYGNVYIYSFGDKDGDGQYLFHVSQESY